MSFRFPGRGKRRRGWWRVDPLAALRKRLIQETEIALYIGLTLPGSGRRIPRVEVGRGSFHPAYARKFWSETLGLDEHELARLEQSLAESEYIVS